MSAQEVDSGVESSEWNQLGSVYYERRKLYDWSAELGGHRVSSASHGGPVAVLANETHLQQLEQAFAFSVFSSSGTLLGRVAYEGSSGLLEFGWSRNQLLVCVHRDGRVLKHDVHGRVHYDSFPLSSAFHGQLVALCRVWSDGIVVLTNMNQLLVVSLADTAPRVQRFVTGTLSRQVLALEVIEPKYVTMESLEIILACGNSVTKCDLNAHAALEVAGEPTMLKVSPNGQFLAVLTAAGKLLVVAADFSKVVSEFDTKSSVPPEQLAWCGADAVALYWSEILLMVGPFGDWIKYNYETPAKLTSELDGLRVITSNRHEFLFRVPESLVNIFSIGCTTPAAMLRDAVQRHDDGALEAESSLKLIGDRLPAAVIGCIRAACHEMSSERQLDLLRVAQFGISYMKGKNMSCDPWALCKAGTMLRILNAVRSPDVGIPLTYAQFCRTGARALVDRLVATHHHSLAAHITTMQSKGVQKVLKHWAVSRLTTSMDSSDSAILGAIREKLASSPGMSYAQVAHEAHIRGRTALVRKLLEFEPKSSAQVPLLNRMGDDAHALAKAIESRDADLIYLTIFHLQRHLSFQDLASMLSSFPQAKALFVAFCKRTDNEMLKSFYYSSGETTQGAQVLLHEAFNHSATHDAGALTEDTDRNQHVIHLCGQASVMYGRERDIFHAKSLEETQRLMHAAEKTSTNHAAANLPTERNLRGVVRALILEGRSKLAGKFRADFNMSERHFYWVKASALALKHDWNALDMFAGEKRPPIGYLPFVELCQQHGAPKSELSKYISKIPDISQRVLLYTQAARNP